MPALGGAGRQGHGPPSQVAAEHNEDRSVIAHIEEVREDRPRRRSTSAPGFRHRPDRGTQQSGVEAARVDLDTPSASSWRRRTKFPIFSSSPTPPRPFSPTWTRRGWEAEGGELSQRAIGYLKRARAANPQSPPGGHRLAALPAGGPQIRHRRAPHHRAGRRAHSLSFGERLTIVLGYSGYCSNQLEQYQPHP